MGKNLLNLIFWGGLFLIGAGCSTGIIDSDEENQTSDCNESEEEETPNTAEQEVKKCIKKCYEILGLEENADKKDIERKFRGLAFKHHPDKPGVGSSSEENKKFVEITHAREAILAYRDYLNQTIKTSFEEFRQNAAIKQMLDYP
jgi:DnaJ-class molecular chaperone